MKQLRLIVVGLVGCSVLAPAFAAGQPPPIRPFRDDLDKLVADGNFKDAYERYRAMALNATTDPDRVRTELKRAIDCLIRLGRIDEIDDFREAVVLVHRTNWRVVQAVAASNLSVDEHDGSVVAGKFQRGWHSGQVRQVGVYDRDRSRALQLLIQGLERARSDPDRRAAGLYHMTLARALMDRRDRGRAWRLQNLTPLDVLADFDDTKPGFPYGFVEQSGAPIEPDGTPVYYRIPESFLKAKNDGERWRWALAQATDTDPGLLNSTRCALASFLLSQFGTPAAQGPPATSGLNALDTLTDDETVAQLASGIKRFKLPDEFNPIKVYQAIASDPQTGHAEEALDSLATIFENRGQLDRAADYLKQSRNVYGEKDDRFEDKTVGSDPRRLGRVRRRATADRGPRSLGRLWCSATHIASTSRHAKSCSTNF